MAEQTWRLVPVNPTREMLDAGAENVNMNYHQGNGVIAGHCYRHMLRAAPTPPAPQAMPPVTLPEPVAFRVEIGAVSLPAGHPSRITIIAFYETEAEAATAADESDYDTSIEPLFTAEQLIIAIADDRKLRGGE